MKTKTLYIFIFSFLLLIGAGTLMWYVREGIAHKIEVVRTYYVKESQIRNFEIGNTLKKEINILNQQDSIIKQAFLEKDTIVDFITYLESSAESRNLAISVEKVEYGNPEILEQKYTITPISFSFELKGSRIEIEDFILQITESEKKLFIKELKLYKNSDEGKSSYTAHVIIDGTTLSYE